MAWYIENNNVYCDFPFSYLTGRVGKKPELDIKKGVKYMDLKVMATKINSHQGFHVGVIGRNGDVYISENNNLYCIHDFKSSKFFQYEKANIISLYFDNNNSI